MQLPPMAGNSQVRPARTSSACRNGCCFGVGRCRCNMTPTRKGFPDAPGPPAPRGGLARAAFLKAVLLGGAGARIDGDACVRTQDMYRGEVSLHRNVHMCPSSPNSLAALLVPCDISLTDSRCFIIPTDKQDYPTTNPLFMCSFMSSKKKKLHTLGIQRRQ